MKDLLVGLDVGTSSVKTAVFTTRGQLLACAAAPIKLYLPQPGWAEQDPDEWWQAVCTTLKQITGKIDAGRISCIGLSGQCPGHVLVGRDHQAIGKAIIWQDQRAVEEAVWLSKYIPAEKAREWIGTDTLGDATCPPARLLWLKKNRPEEWERAEAVIQPKDFIALRLTDAIATDQYSAYCLGNTRNRIYAEDFFTLLDIEIQKMPDMIAPTQIVGRVTERAEREAGIIQGTPVVIGTIDAYCDNLAGGISAPGRAVDVAGTSEIISLSIGKEVSTEGVYPVNLGEGVRFLCGPTQAGGDTLRWLSHCFFPESGSAIEYEKIESEAGAAPAASDGLIFLPYLNGERAPVWDAEAKGGFIGLTYQHERRHYCRAVYESIGYAIRHILESCEEAAGDKAEELVVCGGGSRSVFWNQVKADILQRPVKPTAITETGCLGAAILASVGCGIYMDHREASEKMIIFKDSVKPDIRHAKKYEAGYRAYRRGYQAIKLIFPDSREEKV
jgi:xylulokinase